MDENGTIVVLNKKTFAKDSEGFDYFSVTVPSSKHTTFTKINCPKI